MQLRHALILGVVFVIALGLRLLVLTQV